MYNRDRVNRVRLQVKHIQGHIERSAVFDINRFKNLTSESNRYDRRIDALHSQGIKTQHIEKVVQEAIDNLGTGAKSFVIYGEPQSGKTEMMIALTARLLDEGHKIIIVLLNDNIQLLNQNLERFRDSGIDPTPVDIKYALDKEIGDNRWILFSKKNPKDLKNLNDKLFNKKAKIVIDDEADFASPNAKINRDKRSKINEEIHKLLGSEGIYIGVTATPARLDLNNTFDNIAEDWLCFEPHEYYVGKDDFFPMDLSKPCHFSLEGVTGDDPQYLRKALLSFLVNVAHINIDNGIKNKMKSTGNEDISCSFLIHTSGEIAGHEKDEHIVTKILDVLSDDRDPDYEGYVESMYQIAKGKYGTPHAEQIVEFVLRNTGRKYVEVMNTKKKTGIDTTKSTALFTIIIGGNIISRGITVNNLLGMFFTRDVKQRIQQDTYIQRARMFGNRKEYLHLFELWIPDSLYMDWHKCFVYHYLSLEAIKTQKGAPVWIADNRVTPVASSSIDKRAVVIDSGEMYFGKFQYSDNVERTIADPSINELSKLVMINEQFGDEILPRYVINFIRTNTKPHEGYIAIHKIRRVKPGTDYHDNLYRRKGVVGGEDIRQYPQAIHHIMVLVNTLKECRVVYRYVEKVQFLKNLKKKRSGGPHS